MTQITRDMNIAEVLEMDRGTVPIFFKNGLHCLGCVMASGESIEEACAVHGIEVETLISELNRFFAEQAKTAG
jgi:hybrid cluster-associated redox disulfide protein